jgi:hypothetical protein
MTKPLIILLVLFFTSAAMIEAQQQPADIIYLPHIVKPALSKEIFESGKSNPDYHPFLIFDADPAKVVPTLQEIAGNATSDQEVIDLILAYYNEHKVELQQQWQESNSARLKAFFVMNIIHVSHVYGDGGYPATFVDYLKAPASHCGPQSIYQSRLMSAFGLNWRIVAILSGLHGWVEVKIDGRWEIFDATSNVWINQSSFELLKSEPRKYRKFYMPWTDADRPDARQVIAGYEKHPGPFYYTPGSLRSHMPGMGIYFFGEEYRQETGDKLVISGQSPQ